MFKHVNTYCYVGFFQNHCSAKPFFRSHACNTTQFRSLAQPPETASHVQTCDWSKRANNYSPLLKIKLNLSLPPLLRSP